MAGVLSNPHARARQSSQSPLTVGAIKARGLERGLLSSRLSGEGQAAEEEQASRNGGDASARHVRGLSAAGEELIREPALIMRMR